MVHIFSRTAGSLSRLPAASVALALILALGGCASAPPPNDSMNEAQSSLQSARDAGAADYAPVDLGFAQDKFQQAQAAFADRKYADASNLAEESRADAELATAKARLGAVRAQIQSKTQDNASLRAEGQQVEAAAEQREQQQQQQLQQLQQQMQADPASATSSSSIPTPPPPDMPAPASSTLSAPSQGGEGFQTMPTQTLPDQTLPEPARPPTSSSSSSDPNNPNATNQGGHP